jgi:dipeptidyl-peptidase-4
VTDSFPRRQARTRRFTLGAPRGVTLSPDGDRVVVPAQPRRHRSRHLPVDARPRHRAERLVADPLALDLSARRRDLPPEERARRERSREQAGGIVGYATDRQVTTAAFALSGRLYVVDLSTAPPVDRHARRGHRPAPRPARTPRRLRQRRALHVHDLGRDDRDLAAPDGPQVAYGLADFVAAEEMERMRGYWWSPAGERWSSPGSTTHPCSAGTSPTRATPSASPPSSPTRPRARRTRTSAPRSSPGRAARPRSAWTEEYLADVVWDDQGLFVVVSPATRRRCACCGRPGHRRDRPDHERTDPAWVDIVPGVPAHTTAGALVTVADADGARRLVVDGVPVTPPSLQVRGVLDVEGDTVLIRAARPESSGCGRGARRAGRPHPGAGVHAGRSAAARSRSPARILDADGTVTTVDRRGGSVTDDHVARRGPRPGSRGHPAPRGQPGACRPRCCCRPGTGRASRCRCSWTPTAGRTPSASSPPEGPPDQPVVRRAGVRRRRRRRPRHAGRGPAFERAVHGDLAAPVLDDQVDALHALAAEPSRPRPVPRRHPRLVVRGYLAALAVLRRPDVFHAAVAGAPVTEWALYDTHYTERYLGRPDTRPEAYAQLAAGRRARS